MTREALKLSMPQNSAVFLFPLILSLLPLALYADASNKLMLGYMIFTDFVAVLPVAIKGVEILVAANKVYFSTRSLIRGDLHNRPSTVVASTWSSRCELAQKPTVLGVAFISLAISAMGLGVALEFITKAHVERNKRVTENRKLFSDELDEHLWTRKYICGDCDCHVRSEIAPATGGLIGQLVQQRKEAQAALKAT